MVENQQGVSLFSMSGRGRPLGVLDGSVDDRGVKMEETNVFSKCVGH